MRRPCHLLFVLVLGTAGCDGSASESPVQLNVEEKEQIKQYLREVHQSEATGFHPPGQPSK
ncbi:MAG: hypothetical protein MK171_00575 [Pirellulales bacterium]|nr:hypothetical protein [Pirellulales bacterium]